VGKRRTPVRASAAKAGPASSATAAVVGLGRREIVLAFALVAVVKAVTWIGGFALAGSGLVPFDAASYVSNYHHFDPDPRLRDPKAVEFFRIWNYSDAEWYLSIARSGYPTQQQATVAFDAPADGRRSTERDSYMRYAFFPLYPLIVAAFATVMSLQPAAFVVSLLASLAAAVAALELYVRLFPEDRRRAPLAVALLMAFPFSVFFSLYFPEGLFLLLSLLVFHGLAVRSWPLVGIAGALLAATRPNGIFIVLPVLWVLWRAAARPTASRRQGISPLAWAALVPCGLVAFMAVNQARVQDPVYFHTVQYKWANVTADPAGNLIRNTVGKIAGFFRLDFHSFHSSKVDVLIMMAFGLLLIAMWRDRTFPRELALWASLLWIVPLVSKDLMSFSRYMCVSFPTFYLLARLRRQWVSLALLASFAAAYLAALAGIVGYRWVG
jgi:hypothetical protein